MSNIERTLPYRVKFTTHERFSRMAHRVLPLIIAEGIQKLNERRVERPILGHQNVVVDGLTATFNIKNRREAWSLLDDSHERVFLTMVLNAIKELQEIAKDRPIIFFDIGADQGLFSIFAALAGAKVKAFDPNPSSNNSFQENVDLNPSVNDQITLYQFALGEAEGLQNLFVDSAGGQAPSVAKPTVKSLSEKIEIKVVPLDRLVIEDQSSPMPDIVKIDVEGFEEKVLLGMQQILKSPDKPKHLFVEIHTEYLPKFGSSHKNVERFIISFGYTLDSFEQREGVFHCHFIADKK